MSTLKEEERIVNLLAYHMLNKLRRTSFKRSWLEERPDDLWRKLAEEVSELRHALLCYREDRSSKNFTDALDECADVGNYVPP